MDDWSVDPLEVRDPYAPDCASRAAEGFYVGALYGAVWGAIGRLSSAPVLPTAPKVEDIRPTADSESHHSRLDKRGFSRHLHALGRGAVGYGAAAASTAGVFGVFVGMVNAGTCTCERFRGEKDWFNNMWGGAAAGMSVALLSRNTRTPQMIAAHVAGAAVITSVVAVATGPPVGSFDNKHR